MEKELEEINKERYKLKITNFEFEKEINKNPLNSLNLNNLININSLNFFKYTDIGRKINSLNFDDAEEFKEILNVKEIINKI